MEKIKRVKLKSGTEVYFLVSEKYTTSTVQFVFPVGWRHDKEEFLGLAHFFEHLVGKRTKNYPEKTQLTKFLETKGIMSNAYTSSDITCYHHSQSHKNLLFSLEKLLETIYNSVFNEEDLLMEKGVVMTEARQYLDDDDSFLWHKMMGQIFPGTSLERFYLGNEESLGKITVSVFEDFYKLYLNPKNTKIFIGTNSFKDEKKIINLLNKFYTQQKNILTNFKLPKVDDKINPSTSSLLTVNRNDKTQSNIRLAWKIPSLSEKERITFIVLKRLLTAGFSARLMKKLRDELGLIYGISLGRTSFVGGLNYAAFATTCKKEDKEKVFNLILEEVEKLKTDLTGEEIKNLIPMLEYYEERASNVEKDMDQLIDAITYNEKYLTSTEFFRLLEKVSVKDVQKLTQKIFVSGEEYKAVLE